MTKLSMPTTRVKFGDVAINSTTVSADPEAEGFDRYIIGKHIPEDADHIETWGPVGDSDFGPRIRTIFQPGDVICTTRGPKLKVARVDFKGLGAHTNFYLRTADPDVLLQPYLEAVVRSNGFQQHLVNNFRGSVNLFVNWSDAAKYEFALPPLEEQRRIAEVLQAVVKTLNCTQQITTAADTAYLAALKDFFNCATGPEPADGISSIAGSSKWKWRRVDEMFSLQLGKMSSKKAREGEGHAKYIKNNNVLWGEFSLDDLPTMSFNERERDKFSLEPGDLLVCEGGEIGRAAIWSGDREDIYYQKALHRLRPIIPEASTSFFMHYLRACSVNGILNRIATGGTILHLPRERLAELRLPFPSVSEQARLLNILESLQQSLQESKRRSDHLKRLKNALVIEGMTP